MNDDRRLQRQIHPIREASNSFQHVHEDVERELNRGIRLTAYAMASDGQEVVISDTCGGLVLFSLINDESQYGAVHYIEHGENDFILSSNCVNCMVFTKSGDRLITGHQTRGDITIRARNMHFSIVSVIRREGNWNDLTSLAVSGLDTVLAVADKPGYVELWDLERLTKTETIGVGCGRFSVMSNLHFSPNGESLIVAIKCAPSNSWGLINKKDMVWYYHLVTKKEKLLEVQDIRRRCDGDFPRVFRAGFFDNHEFWVVAGSDLRQWKVSADGIPEQGKDDQRYETCHNFAVSDDRSTVAYTGVAYTGYADVVTVDKFMHTLDNYTDDEEDL